jgi:serine/threonine protein phosphatase PrpC
MVVGQRGRTKLRSNCHSPVGISESNGLLSEQQALLHPQRNLLSNMVGDVNLWVESMPPLALATRDTALAASDGLWDNLYIAEIIDAIRRGTLLQAAGKLAELALRRMSEPRPGAPSKPDDLSFILYRPS